MSDANRKFVVAYVLFVALPLAGLAGVLKAGQRMTAPISVDGLWSVHADAGQLQSLPCAETLASVANRPFVISQSGRTFTIVLSGGQSVAAPGVIEGITLRASLKPSPEWTAEKGCAVREISLVATLDPKALPKSMTGIWTVRGRSMAFHAELQAATASAGGR